MRLAESIKNLISFSDQIFFPSFCLNCKKCTPENPTSLRWLCLECHRILIPKWQNTSLKPEIEESFYIFDYKKDSVARKAILALKYGWVKDIAETFNVYLEKEREEIKKLEFDFIVPMPLHKYRLRERGFNQSGLIAKKISEITGKEIRDDVIERKKYRKPQAEIKKRSEREKNAKGIFKMKLSQQNITTTDISCAKPRTESFLRTFISNRKLESGAFWCGVIPKDGFVGKTILIVDDVATTGATLKECARVLKNSGAEKIISFTLAQD